MDIETMLDEFITAPSLSWAVDATETQFSTTLAGIDLLVAPDAATIRVGSATTQHITLRRTSAVLTSSTRCKFEQLLTRPQEDVASEIATILTAP